jgi:hypothetical protein
MNRSSPSIERRHFLSGLTSTAIGLLVRGTSRAQTGTNAQLAIAYEDNGLPITSDFVGLSYESAILAAGDYFTPGNSSVLGLIRSLGENGVIRIGGNTSEFTVWRAEAKPAASGTFVITPMSVDRLAAALRILGWKLIYGLNLARGTPQEAAEEAAYVSRVVGSNLLAFQIGNEPDRFGRWAWTAPRFKTYNAAAFVAEWRTFYASVRSQVPDAHFAGPDVAGETDWVAALAGAHPEGLVLFTSHYYADGPAGEPHVTLARLLGSDRQLVPVLERLAHFSRSYHLPYRIVEANSVYNEGQPGVSDTLGAALWGLELMFKAAAAGAAGVNFHGGVHNRRPGDDKAYTPIARSASGRHRAQPLYYGILMFAQAARGALVPARLASDSSNLTSFAVRGPDGTLRVCLINKDFIRDARVRIDPGRDFGLSSIMRLTGPAADATGGVTLGGASVDEFGHWPPAPVEEHMPNREITVDVPAASAAVVFLVN